MGEKGRIWAVLGYMHALQPAARDWEAPIQHHNPTQQYTTTDTQTETHESDIWSHAICMHGWES